MSEFEEMMRVLGDEVNQPAVATFGELEQADYAAFTPEKQREYRHAVGLAVAAAILTRSAFLRTCARKWGIDEFASRVTSGLHDVAARIDDATDDYVRA
jgi:hypothetical protein